MNMQTKRFQSSQQQIYKLQYIIKDNKKTTHWNAEKR